LDWLKSPNVIAEAYEMKKVYFAQLPWVARIVLGLATFNLWWSIEEFVIDRFGVWRYLPDYKFGKLCVWDLTVALGISVAILALSHSAGTAERRETTGGSD
jgi:hypothetical protein